MRRCGTPARPTVKGEVIVRILVTGAAGQVGSHLLTLLESLGHCPVGTDRSFRPDLAGGAARLPPHRVAGDLCDPKFLERLVADAPFDLAFHLAGLNALNAPEDVYKVNITSTVALLSALQRSGGSATRTILMSSSAIYGSSKANPITEAAPKLPETHYAVSKAAAEMAAEIHSRENGMDVRIARPFNIVGPGQRAPLLYAKVAAQLVEIERGRKPALLDLGNLESYRDYIDVRDVCTGLVAIAEHGANGQAYNLCSGNAVTSRALVDQLCALIAPQVEIRTAGSSGGDVPYQRGSHDKLSLLSGWQPQIALKKSLRDTLAYWQSLAPPAK